ncbi:YheC/YheD family protein [Bacillaceae bacterium Marseille-Q3522]|nr:YheC/YheD family protein [Bacillaceae bacterium Marseille-Q3522]
MSLHLQSEKKYITGIAKHAVANNCPCFHFVPSSISPDSERIKGEKYDTVKQKWIECEFLLPTYLYDRCFYRDDTHSKQCLSITSWLKSRNDITFLGYGLPHKLALYQPLAASSLAPYLPESEEAASGKIVIEKLRKEFSLMLKPIHGSQGTGIYYMAKTEKGVLVRTDKGHNQVKHIFANQKKLLCWLDQLFQKKKYLMQAYLPLFDQKKRPFDIRVFLQKDGNGNWNEVGKGVRVGKEKGIISNLSAGADVLPFSQWLESSAIQAKEYVEMEINEIITLLPHTVEQLFPPLFELGIDIGLTKEGGIWLLDINSKPGHQVLLRLHPDLQDTLYKAPFYYITHLENHKDSERRLHYEKTLSS